MNALDRARNFRGPLDQAWKLKLTAYFQSPNPTKAAWAEIAHLVINSGGPTSGRPSTVWQAVCAVDSSFQTKITNSSSKEPNDRWDRAPDGFTVARAITAALKE